MTLVKVEKNPNFHGYWDIKVNGFFAEQVTGRARAMKVANQLAKSRGEAWFSFLTFPTKVK